MSNSSFHKLRVKKIKNETDNAISVSFEIPAELSDLFKYKPGQYLTLMIALPDGNERRAYSISSSPYLNEDLTVTIKKVEQGNVSRYLHDNIKTGDVIEAMKPLGNFILEPQSDVSRDLVFIGSGSGITPLYGMIKSILIKEPKSKVLLLYANRNESSIIFKDELDTLISNHSSNFKMINILSRPSEEWNGLSGRINKERFKAIINDEIGEKARNADYFLCGVQGMMAEIEKGLSEMNVAPTHIHKESFTLGNHEAADVTAGNTITTDTTLEKIIARKVKIKLYSEVHEFTVQADETITQAAIRYGEDPPFSCQIGACSTCRAKVVSGSVHLDEREALTDDELKQGYILTCQAHPMSDNVYIDFDD